MFRKSAALHETRQKIKYTRSTSNASCALQRPTSASTTTKSDQHKHVEALFDNLSLPIIHSVPNLSFRGFWWCFFFPPGVFSQLPIGKSEIHPAAQLLHQILHRSCWGDPQNPRHVATVQAEPPGTKSRRLGDAETWLKHGWTYPLVSKHSYGKWQFIIYFPAVWFSIAMLNYQRVLFSTISKQISSLKWMVFLCQGFTWSTLHSWDIHGYWMACGCCSR